MNSKLNEYKRNKTDKTIYEQEKKNLDFKINQLEKVKEQLNDLIKEEDRKRSFLTANHKKINSNPHFKIPYRTESFNNIPCPQGRKTTVCEICLHN